MVLPLAWQIQTKRRVMATLRASFVYVDRVATLTRVQCQLLPTLRAFFFFCKSSSLNTLKWQTAAYTTVHLTLNLLTTTFLPLYLKWFLNLYFEKLLLTQAIQGQKEIAHAILIIPVNPGLVQELVFLKKNL